MSLLESESDSLELTRRHFIESLWLPLLAVGFLWLVHIWQTIDAFDPGLYGIMSRKIWGIRGIVTGPLVHGSWKHLISNSVPLFVLTFLSLYFYRKVAMQAFWMIYFLTGAAVWLFARPVSHIGASGVVYGLVAFIFWNGIFRRSLRSIILAAIVMLLYSGMFMGVLPDQEGISWESHLLGSLVGIFVSYIFKAELEEEEEERDKPDRELELKKPFLPVDIFEKTKLQRQLELEEEIRRQNEENSYFPPFWNQNKTW
ncbi:MAG: rhomboid family intramembrane serine protease [Lewinellaceae bacterium]|nr:rhomboid family intramembrane serine protease [Saprospiraceae bacterium]MCB9342129.1 rhomboid family intramembrane serine protease [Lewinellaceae bacterium]